ncbi:MAG: MBL fold metallo-hydrolase [Bacteroidaceae bacterium]|nr:MBL fold metallo-hydrolase [Bacteroidaceae bacterium]
MKLTFLGTGTSCGVPFIGCTCPICSSKDAHDKRLRTSALLEVNGKHILFDCGPDFRQQMLSIPFHHIDAVLVTHEHYDHVGGLDDLRPYSVFGEVNVYAEDFCATHLEERIPYCFIPKEKRYPGVPSLNLIRVEPHVPINVDGVEILPLRVMHGKLPILGFRVGSLAYITDMKTIDESEFEYLHGIDILVINGLRHKEHPSHQTIAEAVAFSRRIGAKQTYIVHLSHDAGFHAEEDAKLPDDIHIAYDGLVVTYE